MKSDRFLLRLAPAMAPLALAALLAAAAPRPAAARTKLVALPGRDRLALSLDHTQVNLVTEERALTLQAGQNLVDFSWQGVSIDPNSIQIQVLDHPGDEDDSTKVLFVSYPPGENALTWSLFTPEARVERVRILYLLSGFARVDSYEVTVEADEKTAALKEHFLLTNTSGESLEGALIRRGFGEAWTRDLENGEARRFVSFTNPQMPVTKLYVCSPEPFSTRGDEGEIIQLVYQIENTPEYGFGAFKLPGGKTRIFQKDPAGTTIFIGEDWMKDTAVKEKAYLSLGVVKDVTVKRRVMSDDRINVQRNNSKDVVLFDRRVHVRYELQNFKKAPAQLKVVERLQDDWEIEELDTAGVRHELRNNNELEIYMDLKPRPEDEKAEVPKIEVDFVYVMRNQFP